MGYWNEVKEKLDNVYRGQGGADAAAEPEAVLCPPGHGGPAAAAHGDRRGGGCSCLFRRRTQILTVFFLLREKNAC